MRPALARQLQLRHFIWCVVGAIWACTGEPLECTSDSRCPEGTFCLRRECIEPEPVEDSREAYIEQVAPIIASTCSCHGPQSDRPWHFDHSSFDADVVDANFASLSTWHYDPFERAEPTDVAFPLRSAFLGYGIGRCGISHPMVFSGPDELHYQMIEAWLEQVESDLPVSAGADIVESTLEQRTPPATPLAGPDVPDRDVAVSADFDTAIRTVIVPRVVGLCGCCHVSGGSRGWQLRLDATPEAIDQNAIAIDGFVDRTTPADSALLRYGLGEFGRIRAHPKVFTGPDDTRYRVLYDWIAEGKAKPEPDPDPPAPTPRKTYVESIAPRLDASCGACHGPGSGRIWILDQSSADAATVDRNLASMAPFVDLAAPPMSELLTLALGANGHFEAWPDTRHAGYTSVLEWIGTLPATFPTLPDDGVINPPDDPPDDPPPVADGPRAVYVQTVAPILEVGCRCHAPGGGQAWIHEPGPYDDAVLDRNFASLAEWLSLDDPPASFGLRFALGEFGHITVWPSAEDPDYLAVLEWVASLPDEFPALPE